jgi:hypothetical protein
MVIVRPSDFTQLVLPDPQHRKSLVALEGNHGHKTLIAFRTHERDSRPIR